MIEQQPVQDEKKVQAPKEKPDAPAPLGTTIVGPGGGNSGLVGGLGGEGGYGPGGGGGGTKYGWYASEVQSRIAEALRDNPSTRRATMKLTVRIWPDASGRIAKVHLSGSTGDPGLDATIRDNILTGMQLAEPPPSDMPLPIVMRITAQRPQ
jgi:outer membrane biosynthesis protein TonB